MLKAFRLGALPLVLGAVLALVCAPVSAGELFTYQSDRGYSTSFSLKGGTYTIYVNAHLVPSVVTHTTRSCIFGGDFQEVSPKHESAHLGPGVPISTAIHYNLGPKKIQLEAGRYHLFIATMTTCRWRFTLVEGDQTQG